MGPRESELYHRLLVEARDQSLRQYYLAPWIAHLRQLPCYERDLTSRGAVSFNTPAEYRELLRTLEDGMDPHPQAASY